MGVVMSALEFDDLALPKCRYEDDIVDRINRLLTVGLLLFFAVIVTSNQYVGDPISCWAPAHFEDEHEEYTNSYCWVRNTYYLPFDAEIPLDPRHPDGPRRPKRLMYYQWVPLILLVQALGFYLPYRAWTRLSRMSGLDLHSLVEAGQSFSVTDMTEIRDKTLMYMTQMTDRYLRSFSTSELSSSENCCQRAFRCTWNAHQRGNYLVGCYAFVKLLYIINTAAQLYFLDLFLATPMHAYGLEVLLDVYRYADKIQNPSWSWSLETSATFPRVTMCDLKVRRLGAVHDYNVQCVLPINLFNEKIFLFVWFWLVVVGVLNLCSLAMWMLRFLCRSSQRQYVRGHLRAGPLTPYEVDTEPQNKTKRRKFVTRYLSQDGVFLLRLVAHNTSTITATEFVTALWDNYKNKYMADKLDDAMTDV